MALTSKQQIMLRIIKKCGTLDKIAKCIDSMVKEFGEEFRELYVATFWETYHAISI